LLNNWLELPNGNAIEQSLGVAISNRLYQRWEPATLRHQHGAGDLRLALAPLGGSEGFVDVG
jgi:hypothetical protein